MGHETMAQLLASATTPLLPNFHWSVGKYIGMFLYLNIPQQQPWHNPHIPGLLVTPNFLNFGQSTPDWNLTRNPHDWILQAHCTLNWTDIYQQTDVCQQTNISNSRLGNKDGECNLYTWFLTARNPWRAAQCLPAWGSLAVNDCWCCSFTLKMPDWSRLQPFQSKVSETINSPPLF